MQRRYHMAKVITLSRTFPDYHPRAGQPTYFPEKVLNSLLDWCSLDYLELLRELNPKLKGTPIISQFYQDLGHDCDAFYTTKIHTIRSGHRWKQGDKASLRVWSGKPYNSPQIIIATAVDLKEVYDFQIKARDILTVSREGKSFIFGENSGIVSTISKNDGLSTVDLFQWFKYPQPFEGQILCWQPVDYL